MNSPEQVAEFLRWIDWLIRTAVDLGALPYHITAILLLPEALGEAVQAFARALVLAVLVVVGIGGFFFFGFVVLVTVIACRGLGASAEAKWQCDSRRRVGV